MIYLYNVYGISDTVSIEYELNDGIGQVCFTSNDFKTPKFSATEISKSKAFDFRLYKKDSIAIFEFNTCTPSEIENNNGDFETYVSKMIDSISQLNVKYLFIDISANEGGASTYAYQLLDFFVKDTTSFPLGFSIFKISSALKK